MILTVLSAALVLGLSGWIVTAQISSLLRELPEHTETIKAKVKSLKHFASGSSRIAQFVQEINNELVGESGPPPQSGEASPASPAPESAKDRPRAVIIQPQSPLWLNRITNFLSPLLEYLGELALAIILVIFMLQKREEFRNRVIRLVGSGRIVAATKFVDEAGQRISRFLLMQAIVNGSFRAGSGLRAAWPSACKYALLVGLPGWHAPLSSLHRSVSWRPCLPIATTLALTDGWATTLYVVGLFVTLELVVANVVEPWLYGQSMGVSEIALLVSAAFWAFLWGPIGLVLSSPLTVCLVMLGRYVPQLEFLAVLLGDEPALDMDVSFYQRLLARDQDEAEDLILERLKTDPREQVFDTMLIPALCATRDGRSRGEITEADERAILRSIGEIVEDLGDILVGSGQAEAKGETDAQGAKSEAVAPPAPSRAFVIFGCPARDDADTAALEMLEKLLDPARWRMKLIAPQTLSSELLEMVRSKSPTSSASRRYHPAAAPTPATSASGCMPEFPNLRILVGRWGAKVRSPETGRRARQARRDLIGPHPSRDPAAASGARPLARARPRRLASSGPE